MLTNQGIIEITQAIKDLIDCGRYELDNQSHNIEPYSVVLDGNRVSVYFNFGEGMSGKFSNFELLSTSGNTIATKPDILKKPSEKGLLMRFNFEIKEVNS